MLGSADTECVPEEISVRQGCDGMRLGRIPEFKFQLSPAVKLCSSSRQEGRQRLVLSKRSVSGISHQCHLLDKVQAPEGTCKITQTQGRITV